MSKLIINGVEQDWDTFINKKKPSKKSQTPSEKMIERLHLENGYDFSKEAKIVPTGASRAWRGSGRWQWEIKDPLRSLTLGSDSGIRELLKYKILVVCHREGGRIMGYDYLP